VNPWFPRVPPPSQFALNERRERCAEAWLRSAHRTQLRSLAGKS
jgi:hypothetical protein